MCYSGGWVVYKLLSGTWKIGKASGVTQSENMMQTSVSKSRRILKLRKDDAQEQEINYRGYNATLFAF